MLDEWLCQYADRFHDNFPIFFFRETDEATIIAMIQTALHTNQPVHAPYEDDVDY